MSEFENIMLGIAGLLTALLFICIRRRLRLEAQARQLAYRKEWAGRGLDAASLSTKVHWLLRRYICSVHSRSNDTCHRRGLVASARQTVLHRSYFRPVSAEEDETKAF